MWLAQLIWLAAIAHARRTHHGDWEAIWAVGRQLGEDKWPRWVP